MQIIESSFFTTIIPDKGYKIVNKNNGKFYKKVLLGPNDSVDNYGEVVDEKYINMDYLVELDNIKDYNKQNDEVINILLLTINDLYTSIEPLLSVVPATNEDTTKELKFGEFYLLMVKRGLLDINNVPEKFREFVDGKLS